LLCSLILFSCSLEYDSSVSDELSETIPSSILFNVEQVQVKNGIPKAVFSAEEARVWNDQENTEMFNVQFLEFDEKRKTITDGSAEYVVISDNHDATIKGEISGYSLRNEASIQADELIWIDEERDLSSPGEKKVIISLDGGTVLEGSGFSADFFTNTIGFSSEVKGLIEVGSEDE